MWRFVEQSLIALCVFKPRRSSCHRKRGSCQINRQTAFPYQGGACFEKRSYNSQGMIQRILFCVFFLFLFFKRLFISKFLQIMDFSLCVIRTNCFLDSSEATVDRCSEDLSIAKNLRWTSMEECNFCNVEGRQNKTEIFFKQTFFGTLTFWSFQGICRKEKIGQNGLYSSNS